MLLREFPGVVPEACFDVSCSLSSTTTMFVAGAGARSDGADVDEGGGVDIVRDLILARELLKFKFQAGGGSLRGGARVRTVTQFTYHHCISSKPVPT